MEAAGLAIGVVSLYNAVIDILDRVETYNDFETDSQTPAARYDAAKLKLHKWANAFGIHNGELKEHHDARLDDEQTSMVIINILRSLNQMIRKIEQSRNSLKLPPRQRSANTDGGFISVGQKDDDLDSKRPVSKRSRLAWATGGKAKMNNKLQTFENLVNILYEVVPPRDDDPKVETISSRLAEKLDLLSDIDSGLDTLLETATKIKREDVLQWIDAQKEDKQLEKSLDEKLEGTCEWFISHPSFDLWRRDDFEAAGAKFLWVCGPAGFGKSVLCAYLISHLKDTMSSPLAYCFSAEHVNQPHQLDGVIRTWISQITQENEEVLRLVHEVRDRNSSRRASKTEIWTLLAAITIGFHPCTLVLDGLDEFSRDNGARSNFLSLLKKRLSGCKVHVLITSRLEEDIESELSSIHADAPRFTTMECRLSQETVQSDIELFSEFIVSQKLPRHDNAFRHELAEQIAERCEGMFLWIKLQQDRLRKSQNRRTLQQVVNAMPQGLDLVYERDWTLIETLEESDHARVMQILRWLTFGIEALSVQDMAEALAIDPNDESESFHEVDLLDSVDEDYANGEIRGLCGSLVEIRAEAGTISPASRTVHLVHASVKEYLVKKLPVPLLALSIPTPLSPISASHLYLAHCCIQFFNSQAAWDSEGESNTRSFTKYAAHMWFRHIQSIEDKSDYSSQLVRDFLKPENRYFDRWKQFFESERPSSIEGTDRPIEATVMHYACLFGLHSTMDLLHDNYEIDLDIVDDQHGSCLQIACTNVDIEAFDRLLQWGVAVTGHRAGNSTFEAAAHSGRIDMVKALAERVGDNYVPFQIPEASATGHDDIVQWLLDRHAETDVDRKDGAHPPRLEMRSYLSTALINAVYGGHLDTVRVLLDRGADIAAQNYEGDALHWAAGCNEIAIAGCLLRRGAQINSLGIHGTPLWHASRYNHLQMVIGLLCHGADPNILHPGKSGPIHITTFFGFRVAVRFMLNFGADVNAVGPHGTTPLMCAINSGQYKLITMLLDEGANKDAQDRKGQTALHRASFSGDVKTIELLLQKGADGNAKDKWGRTPMCVAIARDRLEAAKLLHHWGAASIGDDSRDLPTHLHVAAFWASYEVTKYLLSVGADVNARNKEEYTPLHSVCLGPNIDVEDRLDSMPLDGLIIRNTHEADRSDERRVEVATLLLENGANFLAFKSGWTPIHMAVKDGRPDLVKLFINFQSSLVAESNRGFTPLMLAVENGDLEIAQILLDHGAEIHSSDVNGWTSLHIAAESGDTDSVALLLTHGHEINNVTHTDQTALEIAAGAGRWKVAGLLLHRGADIKVTNNDQWTLLHEAIHQEKTRTIQRLIERGSDVNAITTRGFTPLRLALESDMDQVVEVLLAAGADPSIHCFKINDRYWLYMLGIYLPSVRRQDFVHHEILARDIVLLQRTVSAVIRIIWGQKWKLEVGLFVVANCLLALGMEQDAVYAYQQASLVKSHNPAQRLRCDNCKIAPARDKSFAVCKSCLGPTFCLACMKEHTHSSPDKLCVEDKQIVIEVPEITDIARQTTSLRRWLRRMMQRMKGPEESERFSLARSVESNQPYHWRRLSIQLKDWPFDPNDKWTAVLYKQIVWSPNNRGRRRHEFHVLAKIHRNSESFFVCRIYH